MHNLQQTAHDAKEHQIYGMPLRILKRFYHAQKLTRAIADVGAKLPEVQMKLPQPALCINVLEFFGLKKKCLRTCGTKARRERRSLRPMLVVAMPSMRMRPPQGSTRRYKAIMRVDLPQPVRPATPTCKQALGQCWAQVSVIGRLFHDSSFIAYPTDKLGPWPLANAAHTTGAYVPIHLLTNPAAQSTADLGHLFL